MPLDCKDVLRCLDEVEAELFRVADDPECQRFHKNSQLTAVLLLLLRASSLLRSMTFLVQFRDLIDGFHLVARGFEETWNLAHDFRLTDQRDRTAKWLALVNDSWMIRNAEPSTSLGKGRGEPSIS